MNSLTVYDPLQKQHYRIINGVRHWQQPRPKEKFLITKDTKIIYLYSDNCYPILSDTAWNQYSKKLQRLAKYQTK